MQDEKERSVGPQGPLEVGGAALRALRLEAIYMLKGCGLEVRSWRLEAKRSLFELLFESLS
jgi:hypothetical protein